MAEEARERIARWIYDRVRNCHMPSWDMLHIAEDQAALEKWRAEADEVLALIPAPAPDQGERDGLAEAIERLKAIDVDTLLDIGPRPTPPRQLVEAIRIARAALLTSTEGPTRVDRDDIVRLTEIRNDWQRKPSRYRDDANLLTRILAALTREAESVRAEATLAAIRAHAGTIWDAHDCKTAAVTYFDGEDAGRNHALTRDESSTEGGARGQRQDSLTDQLRDVQREAIRMGCYDAADFLAAQSEGAGEALSDTAFRMHEEGPSLPAPDTPTEEEES